MIPRTSKESVAGLGLRTRSRAFSLIEVLVVVSIIGLLVAILMPSLGQARASARRAVCQSNLRMIGQGVGFYLVDGPLIDARLFGPNRMRESDHQSDTSRKTPWRRTS